eukprot:Gb_16821 [translate_table: standard]
MGACTSPYTFMYHHKSGRFLHLGVTSPLVLLCSKLCLSFGNVFTGSTSPADPLRSYGAPFAYHRLYNRFHLQISKQCLSTPRVTFLCSNNNSDASPSFLLPNRHNSSHGLRTFHGDFHYPIFSQRSSSNLNNTLSMLCDFLSSQSVNTRLFLPTLASMNLNSANVPSSP